MATQIKRRIDSQKQRFNLADKSASDFVQTLAKLDSRGQDMDWLRIVENATEIFDGTTMRRITVTDPFGGRGHDYTVSDDHADDYGGMLVIVTMIPESERDWIQWIGRTARNDRKGQYAVILNEKDPQYASTDAAFRDKHRFDGHFKSSLMTGLLQLCDLKVKAKLAEQQDKFLLGQRLNELCDHFYSRFRREDSQIWPGNPENERFMAFLSNYDIHTVVGIEDFKRSLGLQYQTMYP